ncbi:MAG: hypothetical protein JNJ61_23060 [Anaerolineae bacterium]|nr:hypothetical protein [Anaerolineae bacterium]
MTLPPLSNWDSTRQTLHQAAQIAGAIRSALVPPLPNYAHLALYVTPDGLTTGDLNGEGTLDLDFRQRTLIYTCPAGNVSTVPLAGHTQATLTDALLTAMDAAGHPASPKREKLTGTTPLDADARLSADYADALHSIYSAIARYRARLLGGMSPLVVWPHGFDLSFLWFARGFEERSDPHLNMGFSPGSPGLPRPYVYVYAYPAPPGMFDVQLPADARWNREPWSGIVIDYDQLAAQDGHEARLEADLQAIYAALAPLLK